jgi:hypothetical protein
VQANTGTPSAAMGVAISGLIRRGNSAEDCTAIRNPHRTFHFAAIERARSLLDHHRYATDIEVEAERSSLADRSIAYDLRLRIAS